MLKEAEVDGSVFPSALPGDPPAASYSVHTLSIAVLTGEQCRKNEMVTLQWDDVDRTAGELPGSGIRRPGRRRAPLPWRRSPSGEPSVPGRGGDVQGRDKPYEANRTLGVLAKMFRLADVGHDAAPAQPVPVGAALTGALP